MEFLKGIAKTLWEKHRKKVIALIMGLLFAALASVSGIPLSEIQDAAKEAASKPAEVSQPAVATPSIPAANEVK